MATESWSPQGLPSTHQPPPPSHRGCRLDNGAGTWQATQADVLCTPPLSHLIEFTNFPAATHRIRSSGLLNVDIESTNFIFSSIFAHMRPHPWWFVEPCLIGLLCTDDAQMKHGDVQWLLLHISCQIETLYWIVVHPWGNLAGTNSALKSLKQSAPDC